MNTFLIEWNHLDQRNKGNRRQQNGNVIHCLFDLLKVYKWALSLLEPLLPLVSPHPPRGGMQV